ncbi:MAG: alpha/beta hydrolase [Pseudomonadota bacterium]
MWFLKLGLVFGGLYLAVIALIYAFQTSMIFPAGIAAQGRPPWPAAAIPLTVRTPEGDALQGVRLPPAPPRDEGRLEDQAEDRLGAGFTILGFGGNAWNAEALALYLHGLYPGAEIVAFHYRGYPPSAGSPSAAALVADAPRIYDHVAETLATERIVAVGLSIGTGVAAHLASERPVAGLILVTPYDTLEALAAGHYPWAPVKWLLRHRISTVDALSRVDAPIAIIAAEHDRVIPPPRTEPVRKAARSLVFDRTIAAAGHNDLYDVATFRAAMLEALARMK